MRPLEFRVWHKPTKRMWPVSLIDFEQQQINPQLPEGATTEEWNEVYENPFLFDDCILMQNTGFLDERGNKIWEGDVLRDDMVQPPEYKDDENEYTTYDYVTYHNGGFVHIMVGTQVANYKIFELYYFTANEDGIINETVVGNMYENPDLMMLTEFYPLHPDHINPYKVDERLLEPTT